MSNKKYKVRIEIVVDSIEFASVEVEANNEKEAKQMAIKAYEKNPTDFDVWDSDTRESRVDMCSVSDWVVDEL